MPGSDDSPEVCVDTMFAAMDKNKDGVLSFEEFREGTRKDQSLLNAGDQTQEKQKTLPTENMLEDTGGLLRPVEGGGTKQPTSDLSVRKPAAFAFC